MPDEAQVRAAIQQYVERAYSALEQIDYYRLLGITSAASSEDVRVAYYRLAARLHPDVHGDDIDSEFRQRLTAVYSRVVEAYKILSDAARRDEYNTALGQGDMRLTSRAKRRSLSPEDSIQDANARRFYKLAKAAMSDHNVQAAVMNCRLALSVDPDNQLIKDLLSEVEGKR